MRIPIQFLSSTPRLVTSIFQSLFQVIFFYKFSFFPIHNQQEMQIKKIRENHPYFDKSLFLFSSDNILRVWVYKLIHARYQYHHYNKEQSNVLGAFSVQRLKKYIETQTYFEWFLIGITWMSLIGLYIVILTCFSCTNENELMRFKTVC